MTPEYEFDNDLFTEEIISPIMNAPEGTLAHAVRDAWAEVAVCVNNDKLYNTVETEDNNPYKQ